MRSPAGDGPIRQTPAGGGRSENGYDKEPPLPLGRKALANHCGREQDNARRDLRSGEH